MAAARSWAQYVVYSEGKARSRAQPGGQFAIQTTLHPALIPLSPEAP